MIEITRVIHCPGCKTPMTLEYAVEAASRSLLPPFRCLSCGAEIRLADVARSFYVNLEEGKQCP